MTSPSQKSVGDFIEGRGIINTEAPRFELEEAPAHWKQSNPPADEIHIRPGQDSPFEAGGRRLGRCMLRASSCARPLRAAIKMQIDFALYRSGALKVASRNFYLLI